MKQKLLTQLFIMLILLVSTVQAYSVSGQVIGAGTGPLVNASVAVYNFTSGLEINSTRTDANGNYVLVIPDISGPYKFNASASLFKTTSKQSMIIGDITDFNFILGPREDYVNITGTILNSSGGVIPGAIVRAQHNSGGTIDNYVTDNNGKYILRVINNTSYTVIASALRFSTNSTWIFVDEDNEVLDLVLIPFSPNGTVTGFVRNSTGSPLNNVSVRLILNNVTVAVNQTASDGSYSIEYFPGAYNLTVSKTGYNDQTHQILINANSTLNINFNLSSASTTCTDTTWTPSTSTVCSGTSFIQTSNCGNTRIAIGTKSCSSSSNSGSSGSGESITIAQTASGVVNPQIKYPDFVEQNPIKYTLHSRDVVVLYYEDVKYTLTITSIEDGKATFKWYPTYETVTLEEGEINTYSFGNITPAKLLLTLLDTNYIKNNTLASTVDINLFLDRKIPKKEEEKKEEPRVVEKTKDAIVKVVGETVSKDVQPSVAVGASISATTVILGLLIFFIVRKIFG